MASRALRPRGQQRLLRHSVPFVSARALDGDVPCPGRQLTVPAACQHIADTLNRRPRKRLGFRTPEQVYAT